jgi:hypothetical protein
MSETTNSATNIGQIATAVSEALYTGGAIAAEAAVGEVSVPFLIAARVANSAVQAAMTGTITGATASSFGEAVFSGALAYGAAEIEFTFTRYGLLHRHVVDVSRDSVSDASS